MKKLATVPYGAWSSPISAAQVTSNYVSFSELQVDGRDLYFLVSKPVEQGRSSLYVLVDQEQEIELTPAPFDVRTLVHEYGGGSYVLADGKAYFINKTDQDIYEITSEDSGEIRRLTQSGQNERFADFEFDGSRNRLLCVRETHSDHDEPENDLVEVDCNTGTIQVLHTGHDFYSNPRISPDSTRMAFLAWDHPNMPWDGTQLYTADLTDAGVFEEVTVVAGGNAESVVQPEWQTTRSLIFLSDRSGFWNLYCLNDEGTYCIYQEPVEYGTPSWNFAIRNYIVMNEDILLANRFDTSSTQLVYVDCNRQLISPCDETFASYTSLVKYREGIAFIAAQQDALSCIVVRSPTTAPHTVLRSQGELELPRSYISVAEPIEYENSNGQTVHANFYKPTNPSVSALEAERPPLLVLSHGGPTSKSSASFNFYKQYYTTRGWAVLDVNYGGSTGYGREYRDRLKGKWGIVDVDDCVAGVRYLSMRDLVDPLKVAIRGGSAGGYTTLRALTTTNVFKAGASHYGVADLRALVNDTHKFESRYIDSLVPLDEVDSRSPIHDIDRLQNPVVFYQGTEDAIVPPNQSQSMYEALSNKGIATALFMFEKESHGFRMSHNIEVALESEFIFFSRVFGIEPHRLGNSCFDNAEVSNAEWLKES